jgi:hypothetical protein
MPKTSPVLTSIKDLYDANGKPSTNLKKAITHFKDRFKEVVKSAKDQYGIEGKTSSESVTDGQGARVMLTFTGDTEEKVEDLRKNLFGNRLVTPTMSSLGIARDAQARGLTSNWGRALTTNPEGSVSFGIVKQGKKVLIQAALVVHHPSDDAVVALMDGDKLPNITLPVKGGALQVNSDLVVLYDGRKLMFGSNKDECGTPFYTFRVDGDKDARGWALLNSARSSGANFDDLLTLARRLGMIEHSGHSARLEALVTGAIPALQNVANKVAEVMAAELAYQAVGGAIKPRITVNSNGSSASAFSTYFDIVNSDDGDEEEVNASVIVWWALAGSYSQPGTAAAVGLWIKLELPSSTGGSPGSSTQYWSGKKGTSYDLLNPQDVDRFVQDCVEAHKEDILRTSVSWS